MTHVTPDAESDGRPLRRIEVTAGDTRYPVVLCDDPVVALLEHLRAHHPKHACCVISDDVVAPLHARRIAEALSAAGRHACLLTFPAGEASKSREVWARLGDAMLEQRLGRDSVVVAVGGGVTTDLAGFVAATYMRGVPVVQVPTSLVAMVDAAIGGKTGIDVSAGKNLVGAFHDPSAVLVSVRALRTLPVMQLREGLVEAVKHGAVADADYYDWILARAGALTREGGIDAEDAYHLVERSVEIKTDVVSDDPLEAGRRAVLNFGHTVAHALEHATGWSVSHGQAVAFGMIVEARIGETLRVTEAGTAAKLEEAVRALALPPIPRFDARLVPAAATADKKNREGALRVTLLRRIGEAARAADGAWTHPVSPELLASSVERYA